MGWTTPQNWTNAALNAANLNIQVRDNLEALKNPPSNNYELDESANFTTTTSANFTNVDPLDTDGKLRLSITTTGGDVTVSFHGVISNNTNPGTVYFNVTMDGTAVAGDDGISFATTNAAALRVPVSFTRLITNVPAGTHIFRLQWKVSAGSTGTLYAGAGTAGNDNHGQFWVREAS